MTEEKLRAEINELKAENATLKEAMRWRNIETEPPKEGQQILAVGHDNSQKKVNRYLQLVMTIPDGFTNFDMTPVCGGAVLAQPCPKFINCGCQCQYRQR